MWNEFVQLFTEMGWISAVLLSLGIVFCIIEIFIPGIGFFGISGSLMVVGGIVVRAVAGASATQVVIMIILFFLIMLAMFAFMTYSAKYGILGRTPIIENGTAISKSYIDKKIMLEKLVGKKGLAITDLNLGGKIRVNDQEFNARTLDNIIHSGYKIEIVQIEDNEIIVKRIV
ncbi:MAG: NfeD family protein [Clostridia bacterium]|nr:NfeD family protein [Clostridia bacterium]